MKKRIKLRDRLLPDYTRGEEIMNMVTHITGGGFGILALVLCVIKTAIAGNIPGIVGSAIYGTAMICYITMGWGIIFFLPQALQVLGKTGFSLLLFGGIAYTIGAVLYGIGSKRRWIHSVFHIFVVLGSILQFLSIYLYSL